MSLRSSDRRRSPVRRAGGSAVAIAFGLALTALVDAPAHAQGRRGVDRDDRPGQMDQPRRDRAPGETGRRARGGQDDARGRGGRGGGRGGGMFGGLGRSAEPTYTRRDLPIFVDELRLDDEQRLIVETIVEDFGAAWRAAAEAIREEMEALRPEPPQLTAEQEAQLQALREEGRALRDRIRAARENGEEITPEQIEEVRARFRALREQGREIRGGGEGRGPGGMDMGRMADLARERAAIVRRWQAEQARMEADFMGEVAIVLSDRQMASWPDFERTVRRSKQMPQGRLSGESLDLFLALREAGVGEDELERIGETTDAWEIEIDQALVARDDTLEAALGDRIEQFGQLFAGGGRVPDTMEEQSRLEADLRMAVRDVNLRYAELVEIALAENVSAEKAERFADAVRERAFGRIFGTSRVDRIFDQALAFEDLDDSQVESLAMLRVAYQETRAERDANLVDQTLAWEAYARLEQLKERLARREDDEYRRRDEPLEDAREARRELDRSYDERIRDVLTPEQRERLPRPIGERGRGPGGMDREAFMQRFDANGDGELDREEREAIRREFRNRRGGGEGPGRRGGGGGRGPGGGADGNDIA